MIRKKSVSDAANPYAPGFAVIFALSLKPENKN